MHFLNVRIFFITRLSVFLFPYMFFENMMYINQSLWLESLSRNGDFDQEMFSLIFFFPPLIAC